MTQRRFTVQIQIPVSDRSVGGGVRHAASLSRGLRELGVRVSLLRTGAPRADRDAEFDEVITCSPRNLPLLWRLPPLGVAPSWIRIVQKATAHVDAVIALAAVPAFATRWALPDKPLIFAPAILDRVEHPETPWSPYKWFEQRAFRSADRVLVRTQAVREAIEHYYRPRGAFGLALPGIDVGHASRSARSRAELGIPPHARLLVTLGLVNENKGQRYIAQALARCAGDDWWWAIVGQGDDQTAIRAALHEGSIAARTVFVGEDPRAADWLAAADLLIAGSRHETFGQAIAEALWAGRPVVIPRNELGVSLSPLAEFVESERLGWTYPRGDADALAAALREAFDDPDHLRQTGARAADFARRSFQWSNYARRALELIHDVMNARPGAVNKPSSRSQDALVTTR